MTRSWLLTVVLLAAAVTVLVGASRAGDAACGEASGAPAGSHPGGYIRPPLWSPDGTRVAFSDGTFLPAVGIDAVYVVRVATGRGTIAVANHSHFPQWSPDSRQLVYGRGRYGVGDTIVSVRANGTQPRVIARDGGNPVWSPDGCWIAFEKNYNRVAIVRPDGSDERILGDGDQMSWSPDGRRLAFTDGDVYIVDVPDGKARMLISPPGVAVAPVWSPDGTQIAYAMGPPDEPNFHVLWDHGTIFVVDVATGVARRVARGNAPAWAPDGSRIAFARDGGSDCKYGHRSIASVRPDGTGLRRLTGRKWHAASPSWSPDGRRLAFDGYSCAKQSPPAIGWLWLTNAAGSSPQPLMRPGPARLAAPSVVGLSIRAARARLRAAGYGPVVAGASAHRRFRIYDMRVRPVSARWFVCAQSSAPTGAGDELQLIATPKCPFLAPRVVGLPLEKALARLDAVGLGGDTGEEPSSPLPEGPLVVCAQRPPGGKIVRVTTYARVELDVHAGRRC